MLNTRGAYCHEKARHDLDVLAQLQEQLHSCSSLPAEDAAALSKELLGLARSWLDQLSRDAELAGPSELRLATTAAAVLAADAELDATVAAAQLQRSLEHLGQTLERIVAPPVEPAATNTDAESPTTHAAAVLPLPEDDRRRQDPLPITSNDFSSRVELGSDSSDAVQAQVLSVSLSSLPLSIECATSPPNPVTEADVAEQTFPHATDAGVVNVEPAIQTLPTLPSLCEPPADASPPSGTRFAESMTFPPELDHRVHTSAPEVATASMPSRGQLGVEIEAPSRVDDGIPALDALSELSRQLEQMCPRWDIDPSTATANFEHIAPAAPEPEPVTVVLDIAGEDVPPRPFATGASQTEAGVAAGDELPGANTAIDSPAWSEAQPVSAYEDTPAVPENVQEPHVEEPPSETLATVSPLEPFADFETFEQSLPSSQEPAPANVADAALLPSAAPAQPDPAPIAAEDPVGPAELQPEVQAALDTSSDTPSDPTAVTELTPEQMAVLMAGGSAPEPLAFSGELTPEQMAALMADGAVDAGGSWGSVPLQLSAEKLQALQFVVAGVSDHFKGFRTTVWELAVQASREDGAELLRGAARKLGELTSVCDFAALSTIRELMVRTAESICAVPEAAVPEVLIRVMSLGNLVEQALRGLEVGMEVRWPLDTLAQRMHLLLRGEVLHPELQGWHQGDVERLLELDRVSESFNGPPTPETDVAPHGAQFLASAAWAHIFDRRSNAGDRRNGGDLGADRRGYGQATLRVPVSSVERMASMVADLVVTKNQILGVLDRLAAGRLTPSDSELARAGSGDLARLTSGLDVTLTMMQVRLQNLGHLFDRFPRVIRDVASVADKSVELRTDSGGVQVDKGMFDALSDPIGQLLRAVVTRSVETPQERSAAGKPATAVIDLRAESKGTTVLITIAHDGRPTPRAEIVERAVELEMLTPELAANLSDAQIQALEFDEHYCDPDFAQIAAKIRLFNGKIAVELSEGQTRYTIAATLGVAVLDAVMVGVDGERYGIPLANVEEIAQVCEGDVSTVRGRAVLRRRDGVVAVIDMRRAMGVSPDVHPERTGKRSGTAVVIKTQHHRAALLVTRVLAKEELVVRSLGAEFAAAKIYSGATISGDGKVNLIVDADRLAEHAHLESLREV